MAVSSSVLLPPGGQRILFVLAHPDDADFLCGGTVSCLAQEGKDLHYLLVTRGDKGSDDPEMTPQRLAAIREREQREAAKVHGVQTVTFLDGYTDGEVLPGLALRREITLVIRQWKPDTVFTLDPWKKNELHPDHRAVGISAVDAVACARGPLYYPEQLQSGITAHHVKDIYYFNTDRPNHWVDFSRVVEQKGAAIRCHTSQMREKHSDIIKYIRDRWSVAGTENTFVEALHHHVL